MLPGMRLMGCDLCRIGMKRDRGIFDAEIAMTQNAMLTPPLYYFDNKVRLGDLLSAP